MSRLVEIITGSPAEKNARKTIKSLESRHKLSKSDSQTLTRARDVSRRWFLRQTGLAVIGVGATLVGAKLGLDRFSQLEPAIYKGPVGEINGEPLIDESRLVEIFKSLRESGFPLLEKVSGDLEQLTTATANPPEFTTWTGKESTPLPITVGTNKVSKAASQIDWGDKSNPDFYSIGKSKSPILGKIPQSVTLGIHLALPEILEDRGPLVQGLYLAKEYMTHMLSMRMQREWWKVNEQFGFVQFTGPNGQPITDPVEQEKVGAGYFLREIQDPQSPIGRTLDAFPVLLLGHALRDLSQRGILDTRNHQGIGGLVSAANLLEEDKTEREGIVFEQTREIINQWVSADSLLPPEGVTQLMLTEPLAPPTLELANFMASQTETN